MEKVESMSHDLNVIFKTFYTQTVPMHVSFLPATKEMINICMWATVRQNLANALLTKSVKLNSSFN